MSIDSRKQLAGLYPLIPLSLDVNEEIDLAAIEGNIDILAAAGVPGCIVFGSMGQMANVSEREFDRVTELAVSAAHDGGLAIVVGSTATFQREAIRRAQTAERYGADGSMLAAPYALPPTPGWAVQFFRDVALSLAGDMSLMLYNYAPLNDVNITAEMWVDLLEVENIRAIKESNTALPHFDQILLTIADKVQVFTGNDPAFFHGSKLGAAGAVGIFAWAGLRTTVRFFEECAKGNHDDVWVRRAFAALQGLSASIRRPDMPRMLTYEYGYLNALVELGGGVAGAPRRPYRPLPDDAIAQLTDAAQPLCALEMEIAP